MKQVDIIQFNCNGVKGHFHHIKQLIIKYSPKFILLQELKKKKSEQINFKGYTLISKHLQEDSSQYPSVGILIKKGIIFDIIDTPASWCVLGINTTLDIPISIFSYYDNGRINKLSKAQLNSLVNNAKNKSILMGDFNARSSIWDKKVSSSFNHTRSQSIINFLNDSDYILMNDGSTTRISPIFNQENSAIDLSILHQDLATKFEWFVSDSMYGSDHLPCMLTRIDINHTTHQRIIWNLKSTNWDVFNVNCDLQFTEEQQDVNFIDNLIHNQLLCGLKSSTHSFSSPNNKKRTVPWWDEELDANRKKKNSCLKEYIRIQSKENLIILKKTEAQYRRMLKVKKRDSWENFIDEMNGDLEIRELWNRVKKIKGSDTTRSITHLVDEQQIIIDDPVKISNMLADHFKNVSSKSSLNIDQAREYNRLKFSCENIERNDFPSLDDDFSLDELLKAISNTKDSAPGPDGYKYKILKNLSIKSKLYLLKFYNIIWRQGKRPESWKMSTVIPFPKSPGAKTPSDVRPINLINTIPKLFDKMVNNRLIFTLETSNSFDVAQYGFRKNKQTLNSMIDLDNYILNSFKRKSHVQMVSFDIKKAFDSVWPDSILKKLQEVHIGGKMYKYVENYLSLRKFVVMNQGIQSDVMNVDIGVPQGSPLSSTLFLIAFQNILDVLKLNALDVKYSAYADDLLICVNDKSNDENQLLLENIIEKIVRKGDEVGLYFSIEKTKSIHICNKLKKSNCKGLPNYIYGTIIEQTSTIRILGLILQSNYKFNKHIEFLSNKLIKDVNVIKAVSSQRYGANQDIIKNLIQALSLSKIRYCIEVYGHTSKANIKIIDTILNNLKRLMLKAFCTTPTTSLSVLSGIPDFSTILKNSCLKMAPRLSNFDFDTNKNSYKNLVNENFGIMELLNNSVRTRILSADSLVSPQKSISNQIFTNIYKRKKEEIDPLSTQIIIRDFLESKLVKSEIYTDGSKTISGVSYAVTTKHLVLFYGKIHPKSSVFTAEAYAIIKALNILRSYDGNYKYAIVTDSRSVLDELTSIGSRKNEVINQIINLCPANVIIVWVPSHMGVLGNILADKSAGDAALILDEFNNEISRQDFGNLVKNFMFKITQDDWNLEVDNKLFKIHPLVNYNAYLSSTTRKQQMVLNRVRSGHSFLTHSYILAKEAPPICKYCDEILTMEHIFVCDKIIPKSYKSISGSDIWKEDLFNNNKIDSIIDFLKKNDYYNLI